MFIPKYSLLKDLIEYVSNWNMLHSEKIDLDCLNADVEHKIIEILNKVKEVNENENRKV